MSSVSLKCKLDVGRANVGSAGLDVGDFQRVSFLLQTSVKAELCCHGGWVEVSPHVSVESAGRAAGWQGSQPGSCSVLSIPTRSDERRI